MNSTTNPCPMNMIFHFNHCERIMWSWWVASEVLGFTFSCLALGVLSFALEAVKYWRMRCYKRRRNENAGGSTSNLHKEVTAVPTTYWQRIATTMHVVHMLLYTLQMIIAYVIMLAFMNFNYWMCLAMIGGLALGHFLFGWSTNCNKTS